MSLQFINHPISPIERDAQHDDWVVIEDQNGSVACRWYRYRSSTNEQAKAVAAAQEMNNKAEELGIKTRYHAVPESMLVMCHQLLVYHREGTQVDWRPETLLPEDYYVQL